MGSPKRDDGEKWSALVGLMAEMDAEVSEPEEVSEAFFQLGQTIVALTPKGPATPQGGALEPDVTNTYPPCSCTMGNRWVCVKHCGGHPIPVPEPARLATAPSPTGPECEVCGSPAHAGPCGQPDPPGPGPLPEGARMGRHGAVTHGGLRYVPVVMAGGATGVCITGPRGTHGGREQVTLGPDRVRCAAAVLARASEEFPPTAVSGRERKSSPGGNGAPRGFSRTMGQSAEFVRGHAQALDSEAAGDVADALLLDRVAEHQVWTSAQVAAIVGWCIAAWARGRDRGYEPKGDGDDLCLKPVLTYDPGNCYQCERERGHDGQCGVPE